MQVVVDVLVPQTNASNGVFVATRVDRGGCTTFLARGVFFYLLFGNGQLVIANDLGQCVCACTACVENRCRNPFLC